MLAPFLLLLLHTHMHPRPGLCLSMSYYPMLRTEFRNTDTYYTVFVHRLHPHAGALFLLRRPPCLPSVPQYQHHQASPRRKHHPYPPCRSHPSAFHQETTNVWTPHPSQVPVSHRNPGHRSISRFLDWPSFSPLRQRKPVMAKQSRLSVEMCVGSGHRPGPAHQASTLEISGHGLKGTPTPAFLLSLLYQSPRALDRFTRSFISKLSCVLRYSQPFHPSLKASTILHRAVACSSFQPYLKPNTTLFPSTLSGLTRGTSFLNLDTTTERRPFSTKGFWAFTHPHRHTT